MYCVTKVCVLTGYVLCYKGMCCNWTCVVLQAYIVITGYVLCYKGMCCFNWICIVLQGYVLW